MSFNLPALARSRVDVAIAAIAAIAVAMALGLQSPAVGANDVGKNDAGKSDVRKIDLPPETAVLRSSLLPGYEIAVQKCGICHSADYVNLQPLGMSVTQWAAEMTKMRNAYGAPLDEIDINLLSVYLATAYADR
jgi:hypothetical protein